MKKRWFGRSHSLLHYFFSAKDICTINVTVLFFFFFFFSFEIVWKVFLFQTVGRVIVPDILFRDRTCLVFCFLGCVVKFQAREAIKQLAERCELASWQSSLCAFCLSFFLFFFFSFLLLALFPFSLNLLRARVGGAPLLSKSTHCRKFDNHVTVHRPPTDRPSVPTNQCLLSHF